LQELARSVHAENKEGQKQIKIAKVDGDAERAIISRFNIAGFPSFFLIDGWTVYEYNDGRSVSSMMTFVKGGYKQKEVSCRGEEFFCFLGFVTLSLTTRYIGTSVLLITHGAFRTVSRSFTVRGYSGIGDV
jgi:hypothetical protein